jgi:hypothetical protein
MLQIRCLTSDLCSYPFHTQFVAIIVLLILRAIGSESRRLAGTLPGIACVVGVLTPPFAISVWAPKSLLLSRDI